MQIDMENRDKLTAHAGSDKEGEATLSAHGARTVMESQESVYAVDSAIQLY